MRKCLCTIALVAMVLALLAACAPAAAPAPAAPAPAAVPTKMPAPKAAAPKPAPTGASVFWADQYLLTTGKCTTLHWNVENVISVHLDGEAVTGNETRQVCPAKTIAYVLSVESASGQYSYRLPMTVQEKGAAAADFYADADTIVTGQCTQLHWETSDVSAVYLDDAGVEGVTAQQVCPTKTTTYNLKVEWPGGSTTKSVSVEVLAAAKIALRFWAEQYALKTGACTNLHWSAQDVTGVFLKKGADKEEGVADSGDYEACPSGSSQVFTLRAEAGDGRTETRQIALRVLDGLQPNEVIAQGLVNEVLAIADADPTAAGNQTGFEVVIDRVNPLFSASFECCQAVVKLHITKARTSESAGDTVDWPVNPGQSVEFGGTCADATCATADRPSYLKLRSR